MQKYILDSSFFFGEAYRNFPLKGELLTTNEVKAEIKDFSSRMAFSLMEDAGLKISVAAPADSSAVKAAAAASGDLRVLSDTDISVIALALSMKGVVVSSDFAVQNVCRHLQIPVKSLLEKTAKKKVWKRICSGCGAEIPDGYDECQICGSKPVPRGTERNHKTHP
ncbi:MAG: nucleotide-binding protein [Methanocorpusculum sp.]|nr:nucleotide-binding protein [Methanocorpusculum sp.]